MKKPTKNFVHFQEFKINNPYSEEKINKIFYQCTVYLLSFDMDVFFKRKLRIHKIHERSLRLILNDFESFDSLLFTLNEKAIHQRCINALLTKVYQHLNSYSPDLMNEVFYLSQIHYNLRNFNVFATDNWRSNYLLNSSVYRVN